MKQNLLLSLVAFLFPLVLIAQEATVSGTVTGNRNEPLAGVNIVIQGTTTGTTTDFDGRYTLRVPSLEPTVLEFRYIGHAIRRETVNPQGASAVTLNVELSDMDMDLNPVVVSASRRQEKVLDAPASITVLGAGQIEEQIALTSVDHLRSVPGVDVMQTGLVGSNVTVRGFNNIFSGAMMTLVDNRIASVPSLMVNAYQLIPTSNHDIERIEVVRGPASALYGPNATSGVMHMITKSPLDMQKDFTTTISIAGGERGVFNPEVYHAGKFSDRIGYKVSGNYFRGNDWEYYDSREPAVGDTVIFGTVRGGDIFSPDTIFVDDTTFTFRREPFDRDFFTTRIGGDARLDFRITDNLELILSGGITQNKGLELTGLGAAQVEGWRYSYFQSRLRYRDLYVQYFINSSNAGETFLIPQGGNNIQYLIDKSKLHVVQLQHSFTPLDNLNFTYGADFLMTRPDTEGTINGRFEDDDEINQIGGYLQAEYDVTEQITLVGATRVDYHDVIEEVVVSPRGAIVFKPTPRHTLRATYNRAFSTPSSLNLFLDISNGLTPSGFNVRGIGNPNGYQYRFDESGVPMFNSPYDREWYSFNDLQNNHFFFDNMTSIIAGGLAGETGFPQEVVGNLVNSLMEGIASDTGTIQTVSHASIDYINMLQTGNFAASQYDISGISNLDPIQSSITQTAEIGYKGLIGDRLMLSADFYYSRISNFVSPLTLSSASVIFHPQELLGVIGGPEDGGTLWDNIENSAFKGVLTGLLDGDPRYQDPTGAIPYTPNSPWNEIVFILLQANAGLTAGAVTPDDDKIVSDVILTYINLGEVDVAGTDLGFTYLLTNQIKISGAYSFVNKDRVSLEGAARGYVALNAPKHKTSLSFEHHLESIGVRYGVNWRWQDAFPANSAVYIGDVDAANYLDVRVSWRPWFSEKTQLSVNVSNILNYKHQPFPGTPSIGRMTLARVTHTF